MPSGCPRSRGRRARGARARRGTSSRRRAAPAAPLRRRRCRPSAPEATSPIVSPTAWTIAARWSSGHRPRDGLLELRERTVRRLVLADAGERARDLGERQVRDPVAVRDAAPDEDARVVSPATNSETRRLFPTPAWPKTVTSCGLRSRATRFAARRRSAISSSRPTNGAFASRTLASGPTTSRALHACDGRSLSLRVEGPADRGTRSRAASSAASVSPTSTSPGSASCCSLAATFTASPVTMSSPRAAASRPAMTSPVLTPMRRPTSPPCSRADPRRESAEAVADRDRGPHRALGIVLVRLRDPEDGEDRIADELLRNAAVALDLGVHELEEIALERPHVLGVEPLPERGRAGEVGEENRDDAPLLLIRHDRRAPCTGLERGPARGTERGGGRLLGAAGGALASGARLRTSGRSARRPGPPSRTRRTLLPRAESTVR